MPEKKSFLSGSPSSLLAPSSFQEHNRSISLASERSVLPEGRCRARGAHLDPGRPGAAQPPQMPPPRPGSVPRTVLLDRCPTERLRRKRFGAQDIPERSNAGCSGLRGGGRIK